MPLTSSAADVLGVATLVLVLLLICAGLGCIAYVLYFRRRIQRERQPALQDFNALWIVRIILIVLAVLWSLVELLRLPLLRKPNWIFHSWSFRAQANVCRFYILSSLGFLEPCFFLTALFLVHGSLRKAPFTPRRAWNGKVVVLILICCLPVFLFQLFFVVISPNIEFKKSSGAVYNLENEGYGGKVPYYFTQAFVNVTIDSREVAVCCYPFLSTLALASFGILYSAYFLVLGWRVVRVVINRYLQRRLYGLLGALLLLLPLHVLFLGLSVLSKPTHIPFELLSFFGFIMVLLCTTVGEGILVIRPIADALAVGWVVYAASESGRDTDAPGEGLVSLSVFGSDDDEAALVGSRALFAKSQSRNRSRDAEDSEFGSARRSFLRPTGSFSEHNGIPFLNPDSPALPGKPLIAHHHHQNQQPFYPFL